MYIVSPLFKSILSEPLDIWKYIIYGVKPPKQTLSYRLP